MILVFILDIRMQCLAFPDKFILLVAIAQISGVITFVKRYPRTSPYSFAVLQA